MLSVFLRASAVITVIFFQSPHRVSEGEPLPAGLRRGFETVGSNAGDVLPLARLWSAIPSETRKDAVEAIATEASGAWLRRVTVLAEKVAGSEASQKPAGRLWQNGPLPEARRVYP